LTEVFKLRHHFTNSAHLLCFISEAFDCSTLFSASLFLSGFLLISIFIVLSSLRLTFPFT